MRSETLVTFALCGIANFSSVGVVVRALGLSDSEHMSEVTGLAVRDMIAGNISCFLTACIAGNYLVTREYNLVALSRICSILEFTVFSITCAYFNMSMHICMYIKERIVKKLYARV